MSAAERKAETQKQLDLAAKTLSPVVKAGKKNVDQLLRALIPLYLVPRPLTSGDVHRFWLKRGVEMAHTNIAQQWRKHVGYTRRKAKNAVEAQSGWIITPNGIKYVEAIGASAA